MIQARIYILSADACISHIAPVQRAERTHSLPRELGIGKQAGSIREPEQLDKMEKIARTLLAADHDEMVLPAIQPGEKDHAGFVKAGRRAEHVARQAHGGGADRIDRGAISTA